MSCRKCDGTGKTLYTHVRGGVCFKCWGSGDSKNPGKPEVVTSRFQNPVRQDVIDRGDALVAEAEAILGRTGLNVGEIEEATGKNLPWF